METKIEGLQHELEIQVKNLEDKLKLYGDRLRQLENRVYHLEEHDKQLSVSFGKMEGLLEHISEAVGRIEQTSAKNFEIVNSRISSTKEDFEASQRKELENYIAYKKIVIGAVLTTVVGGLVGAVLTSYRLFGP